MQYLLVLLGADEVAVWYANHFVIQFEQNEFFLTVGSLTPPILLGTEEERREQLKQISYVPVKVLARLAMTRPRLVELITALTENLKIYDEIQRRQA